jgi:hypothetical protein
MRGDIPPLPNTRSRRGAQLKYRDNFTFYLYFKSHVPPTHALGMGKKMSLCSCTSMERNLEYIGREKVKIMKKDEEENIYFY